MLSGFFIEFLCDIHFNTVKYHKVMTWYILSSLISELQKEKKNNDKKGLINLIFSLICQRIKILHTTDQMCTLFDKQFLLNHFFHYSFNIFVPKAVDQRGLAQNSEKYKKQLQFCPVPQMSLKGASETCRSVSHKIQWQLSSENHRWRRLWSSLLQSGYVEWL